MAACHIQINLSWTGFPLNSCKRHFRFTNRNVWASWTTLRNLWRKLPKTKIYFVGDGPLSVIWAAAFLLWHHYFDFKCISRHVYILWRFFKSPFGMEINSPHDNDFKTFSGKINPCFKEILETLQKLRLHTEKILSSQRDLGILKPYWVVLFSSFSFCCFVIFLALLF